MNLRRRLRIRVRENWYRDVWLLIVTVFLIIAVIWANDSSDQAKTASHQAKTAVVRVQQGRRAGIAITCAVLSSVGEAGRAVIVAGTSGPETPFTRNLEKLGYPPLPVRRSQSQMAAAAYVDRIASGVEDALGGRRGKLAKQLVKANGTIDCDAFLRLANVRP